MLCLFQMEAIRVRLHPGVPGHVHVVHCAVFTTPRVHPSDNQTPPLAIIVFLFIPQDCGPACLGGHLKSSVRAQAVPKPINFRKCSASRTMTSRSWACTHRHELKASRADVLERGCLSRCVACFVRLCGATRREYRRRYLPPPTRTKKTDALSSPFSTVPQD